MGKELAQTDFVAQSDCAPVVSVVSVCAVMGTVDIDRRADALRAQMEKRLGLRAKSFAQGVRRAGRRLPKRVRRAADVVLAAQALGGNPKLERQIDRATFEAACREIAHHLDAVDLAEERKDRRLRLAALVALQFLVVLAAFVVWLWWSGTV